MAEDSDPFEIEEGDKVYGLLLMESVAVGFWEGLVEYYQLHPALVLDLLVALGIQNGAVYILNPQAGTLKLLADAAAFTGLVYGAVMGAMAINGLMDATASDGDIYAKAEAYAGNTAKLLCSIFDITSGSTALLKDMEFFKQTLAVVGESTIDILRMDAGDFAILAATKVSDAMAGVRSYLTEETAASLEKLLTGQPVARAKEFLVKLKQCLMILSADQRGSLEPEFIGGTLWKLTEDGQSVEKMKKAIIYSWSKT